jgi:hypothetical protein
MQIGQVGDPSSGKFSGNTNKTTGGGVPSGFSHPKIKVALIIWFAMSLSQAQFYLLSLQQTSGSDGFLDRDLLLLIGGVFTLLSQVVRHVPAFKGSPQKCFTGFIIALALSEMPGLLGFLDAMKGGGSALWLQIMSVAAFAMNFPTIERLGLLQPPGVPLGNAPR